MSYKEFSYFYDYFNYNADYDKLFLKIKQYAAKYGVREGILCDLGCGTGELAFRFDRAGFDVIAVDNSDEMLDVIFDKRDEEQAFNIQILKQDITELDMYGTVDLFTCTFDTVNHLEGAEQVKKLFDKVSLFMHPDGVFIFDMNTKYKHLNVLADNKFDFIEEEADCHWKNTLYPDINATKIDISIYDKTTDTEYNESFFEYFYDFDMIKNMIEESGMVIEEVIDGENFGEVHDDSQRYLFVVRKEK